ncbi:hypothetical protein Cni_G20716 [Canna indica]|uniref:Uncharacterized protein n=1 Tax=Canna indica TaxID=4628 RepID=A0AAQ3KN62_9LILI|nr:hypothetical protein Cni_G20716 [Canna indica]
MGACASKPIVQGDAPLPMEEPASTHDPKVADSRDGEELAAVAPQEADQQGTPEDRKYLGGLFQNEETADSTETTKNVVSETLTSDSAKANEEESEQKPADEELKNETEEETVADSTPEDGKAIAPQATSEVNVVDADSEEKAQESGATVEPADSSEVKAQISGANVESVDSEAKGQASDANAEPADSEAKAQVEATKVESASKEEEKKGDVFRALFTVYNNLVNNKP